MRIASSRETPQPRKPLTPQEEQELLKPLAEIYFDREQRTERTIGKNKVVVPPPKPKTKTKGTTRPVEAAPVRGTLPVNPPEKASTEKFAVDKRALKVFKTLFHTPGVKGGQPCEVVWTSFIHAMTSIGFSAQKQYGSVWQFTPEDTKNKLPIQFHEPHPSGKLPFRWAKQIGRRLTRAYGF